MTAWRTTVPVMLALAICVSLLAAPAYAHSPYDTDSRTFGSGSFRMTASTDIGDPGSDSEWHCLTVPLTSGGAHFVKFENLSSGPASVQVSYNLHLEWNSTQVGSVNSASNYWISVAAGGVRVFYGTVSTSVSPDVEFNSTVASGWASAAGFSVSASHYHGWAFYETPPP